MTNFDPPCFNCKHFDVAAGGCAAFPDGIPDEIINNFNDHTKPLPDQGNDIVFEKAD